MTEKRVAFVTGGSRGIGAAIVKRLAKDGLHVVAVARSADKLQQVVDEVKARRRLAPKPSTCDIADAKALADAIEQIAEKHGRLDVLVNNAGITKDGLLLRMDDEDFDAVINTNLKSAFVAIRAAARPMMRIKGRRRADHQHQLRRRRRRQRGAGELRRQQGRADRADQDRSPRNWPARTLRATSSRPVHHDRHDRRAERQDQGTARRASSRSSASASRTRSPPPSRSSPAPMPATSPGR